jgi:hypothetical protein
MSRPHLLTRIAFGVVVLTQIETLKGRLFENVANPVPIVTKSFVPSGTIALTPPAPVSATQFDVLPVNAKFVRVPFLAPNKSLNVVVPFPTVSRLGHHTEIGSFPFTANVSAGVKL